MGRSTLYYTGSQKNGMPENSVHSMESRPTSTSLQLKEDVKKEEPKEEPEDAPSEGLDD